MWRATRRSTGPCPSGKGPPKGSRGRPESPLVASAAAKSFAIRGRIGRLFSCLPQGNRFIYKFLLAAKGPKVSKGRSESPLVASAEAKPFAIRGRIGRPFSCLPQGNRFIYKFLLAAKGPKVSKGRPESPLVASAEAKSFAIRGRIGRPFSCLPQGNRFIYKFLLAAKGPKVSKGRSESPLVASAEAKSFAKQKKESKALFLAFHKESVSCGRFRPPAGGRGTFPHGKVPKGCRGRPKGACLMAAPGPPVAKIQCTASLAGARPAGFTSVPGRATVAFGAADPSPGSWAPVYPWSDGKKPLRQENLVAVRAAAQVPGEGRTRPGTRLVAGPGPNQMACPIRTLSVEKQGEVPLPVQGGLGVSPRPFEGGIGGPGGHRGGRNPPCPPGRRSRAPKGKSCCNIRK